MHYCGGIFCIFWKPTITKKMKTLIIISIFAVMMLLLINFPIITIGTCLISVFIILLMASNAPIMPENYDEQHPEFDEKFGDPDR